MTTSVTVQTIYHCSLERAFKTPMLCDVSKVHTGYGIMPKVTEEMSQLFNTLDTADTNSLISIIEDTNRNSNMC
jgi:2-succinyl-5-enolpyruvyl-6-hydroxy-3-cyclohexene-1-carboxylate synthase